MKKLSTSLITDVTEDTINIIFNMQSYFKEKLRYTRQEIIQNLNSEQNIGIFLEDNHVVVGYVFAVPHDLALKEFQLDDPLVKEDSSRYYIDQVSVLPEARKGLAFLHLGYSLFDELGKRGMNKVSSHLSTTNGVHKIIGRSFGHMYTTSRHVHMACWDDIFEYIEVTYIK